MRRVVALAVAAVMAATLGPLAVASAALPSNSAPAGRASTFPASGTTSFQLLLPAGAACPGDSASAGYRWQTFLTASTVDVSQLTYLGGVPSAPAGAQVDLLYSSGNPFVDVNTAVSTGAIVGLPNTFEYTVYPAHYLAAGAYQLGVACTLNGAVERYWSTTVQLSLDGAGLVSGFTPFNPPVAGPTLGASLALGVSGTISGTFAPVTAAPAVQSYRVTATPAVGSPVSVEVLPPATSFTIGGLSNRDTYTLTATATNAAGTSPPSAGVTAVPYVANPAPTQLAAGVSHSCARSVDGSVRCWGANANGQLGNGTLVASAQPVRVNGVSGATQVAAGDRFSCAVSVAKVQCWGLNTSGQLGDGTHTARAVPTSVMSSATVAAVGGVSVAAGAAFACVISNPGASGTLRCWGANESGQLGDGTTVQRTRPVAVNARAGVGLKGVASVAAGGSTACAVMSTGAVRCWGRNTSGQLGNGTLVGSKFPSQVSGIDGIAAKATSVAVGADFACARLTSGAVRCWGNNASGQLGHNATARSAVPVAVKTTATSVLSGAISVSAGAGHACAIRGAGGAARVLCWGANGSGQLGLGDLVNRRVATVLTSSLLLGAKAVALGGAHTLAVAPSAVRVPNDAVVWGRNADGQLGVVGGQRTSPVVGASL